MDNKESVIKIYSITYGKDIFIVTLVAAGLVLLLGIFLLPKPEGIAVMLCSLLLVLYSFGLLQFKYLNYIMLTNTTVATKKKEFTWNEVCITMSLCMIHATTYREDYYLFFDDHYLNKEEINSRRVKKEAFYIVVTHERLNIILQRYNKRIKLMNRSAKDRKNSVYDRVLEHNSALDKSQECN